MYNCPEKQKPSPYLQGISPLERLLRTKPIWFLPDESREESAVLLQNKHPGVGIYFTILYFSFNPIFAEFYHP
jgi:hypothetical protein